MKPKIYTIIGARPQLMKIDKKIPNQKIIWTGQHYDYQMSQVFFKELKLPKPYANLHCKSSEAGKMFDKLTALFKKDKPNLVLVYGDTISTLMGALAAHYSKIPFIHIEAGARIHDWSLPEEANRVIADRLATARFCFTLTCYRNLNSEGLLNHSHYLNGDPMYDAMNDFLPIKRSKDYQQYILLTLHRNFNTDDKKRLQDILDAVGKSGAKVIFPIHPRTRQSIKNWKIRIPANLEIIKPVSYRQMLVLESNAKKIITDSGGVQREAYWMKIPCIILRDKVEWVETVKDGWSVLVDADKEKIIDAIHNFEPQMGLKQSLLPVFGVQKQIREIISRYL